MIKLIKEEQTLIKPVATELEDENTDVNIEELNVDKKMAELACEEMVNNLIQQSWDMISNVNSVIATLDVNYDNDNKEKITELLNLIIDDYTIDIGMLQKVVDIMNIRKGDLLYQGEDKAEKILATPEIEQEVDVPAEEIAFQDEDDSE